MKKFLFLVLFALTVSFASAQDVVKFLGIPVDGPKSEMIKKLQEKGFKYDSENDLLHGMFNGEVLSLRVYANRDGKVWQITLLDTKVRDKDDIKTRFNMLLWQFLGTNKYVKIMGDIIPDSEDIEKGILIDGKKYQVQYQAHFLPSGIDVSDFEFEKLKDLTEEKIQELTEEEQLLIMEKVLRLAKLSCVWFQIGDSSGGGYIICMYYTNPNNDPRNGADL